MVNNLTSKDEIVKKINFIKRIKEKNPSQPWLT
jgi:hypothetical protein